MLQIRHYLDHKGCDHFSKWRTKIKDSKAKIAIDRRIMRLESGNFGDHKYLRNGVSELRIDVGQGYRVYYAQSGTTIVLLCGGSKSNECKQSADIEWACDYWHDWQQRTGE